jgi:glycosyltransferase involved in cell wall biosynthesis
VYDAPELYAGMHTLPRSYRALLDRQERIFLRRVDRFIAVNPAIARVLERRHGRAVDTVVLNCPPYEPELPSGRSHGIRAAFGLPDATPILVYSGGLLPDRGIEQTVLALHHLPDVFLAILGEGELRPRVEALARRERLDGRIGFSPYVRWNDVARFIASADVGIVPYLNTGPNQYLCSPGKLFEYVMAGLPVAASAFPFLRTVVNDEHVGRLFDPSEPRSIATAVREILEDKDGYRRSLATARRRYSWDVEGRRFVGVFESLAGSSRPTRRPRSASP